MMLLGIPGNVIFLMVKKSSYVRSKERYEERLDRENFTGSMDTFMGGASYKNKKKKSKFEIVKDELDVEYVAPRVGEKKGAYTGKRITHKPNIITTRHGVVLNLGRTQECQNFIEDIVELGRYGYPLTSFTDTNARDWQTKLAVIYSFFAKHNRRFFQDQYIWLLVHADLLFSRFSYAFKKDLPLNNFIRLCRKVRSEKALEDFKIYGPAFYPKGYIHDSNKNLFFFHQIPISHLKSAQESYESRHYKNMTRHTFKELHLTPPLFEVKLIQRTPMSHHVRKTKMARQPKSKPVSSTIKPDLSITDPKKRIDDLRRRLKGKVEFTTSLEEQIKMIGVKRVVVEPEMEIIPEPQKKKLSVKQIKKNSAAHRKALTEKRQGKGFSSDNAGDGPKQDDLDIIAFVEANPGCTAVQIAGRLKLNRSYVNTTLYSCTKEAVLRMHQPNPSTKPTWYSFEHEIRFDGPRNATGHVMDVVVSAYLSLHPGSTAGEISRDHPDLHADKHIINSYLYASPLYRFVQADRKRPPRWFLKDPDVVTQLNGANGEHTGLDDVKSESKVKQAKSKRDRIDSKAARSAIYMLNYSRDTQLYTPLQKQKVYEKAKENRERRDRTQKFLSEMKDFEGVPNPLHKNDIDLDISDEAISNFASRNKRSDSKASIIADDNPYSALSDSDEDSDGGFSVGSSYDAFKLDSDSDSSSTFHHPKHKKRRKGSSSAKEDVKSPKHESTTPNRPTPTPTEEVKNVKTCEVETPPSPRAEEASATKDKSGSVRVDVPSDDVVSQVRKVAFSLKRFEDKEGLEFQNKNFTREAEKGLPEFTPKFLLDKGLRVWEMGGEGDCFYHSVGFQLDPVVWNCDAHCNILRTYVHQFMQSNQNLLEGWFVPTKENPNYKSLLKQVRRPKVMVEGQLEIISLATVFRVVINVYSDVEDDRRRQHGYAPTIIRPLDYVEGERLKEVNILNVGQGHFRAVLKGNIMLYRQRKSHVLLRRQISDPFYDVQNPIQDNHDAAKSGVASDGKDSLKGEVKESRDQEVKPVPAKDGDKSTGCREKCTSNPGVSSQSYASATSNSSGKQNVKLGGLSSYIPKLPGVKNENPDLDKLSSIPLNLYSHSQEEILGEVYSLTTSKFAKNKYGLFILQAGEWVQVKSKGGMCETFDSLGLKPIQAPTFKGKIQAVEGLNLFTKSGTHVRVVRNPIEEKNDFVYSTATYRWFSSIRTKMDNFLNPDKLYNGYTELKRTIYIDREIYTSLRRKITSATTDLMYLSMFNAVCQDAESIEIVLDTVLYVYELKTRLQAAITANVQAHADYLSSKHLWQYPVSGVQPDPFSETYLRDSEGVVCMTSRSEALHFHNRGKTCVARQSYTGCSSVYGSYNNPVRKPGRMLEPLSKFEAEEMSRRGVDFKDPYIQFKFSEDNTRTVPHQSIGGGFATTAAVIDHTSVRESEMAHSRILFSRDDELEQRYKATRFWDEVCTFFDLIQSDSDPAFLGKFTKDLDVVVKGIRELDPKYMGGDQIYSDWDDEGKQHIELPPNVLFQAFTQACIHDTQSDIPISHEEARIFDDTQALEDYVREVGAKLALRLDLVDKIRTRMTKNVASKVNLVQCKPHEFQKYKIVGGKPALKYARDVISITGEDWVAARPQLLAYVKKSLEGTFTVDFRYEELTVSGDYYSDKIYVDVTYSHTTVDGQRHDFIKSYQVPTSLCKHLTVNNLPMGLSFRYQSVISDTSLDTLSKVMTEVHSQLQMTPGLVYALTHGDDQIVGVHNINPDFFGGRLGIFYIEGDINDNDGSHVDPFYRLDLRTFSKRTEDVPHQAFIQLSKPLMLVNPQNPEQYCVMRRRHGMQMCSGSVHTTYGNSKMSMNVALSQVFNPRLDYGMAASSVGMTVTSDVGDISDVTFLSKNFYSVYEVPADSQNGLKQLIIKCYTDIASLARKVSRCTGDVAGKTREPICKRFDDHNRGVVMGWVNEPDSLFKKIMWTKYVDEKPDYKKIFGKYVEMPRFERFREFSEKDLSPIDLSIIRHYYPNSIDEGVMNYISCVNMIARSDTYGHIIKSRFIDRTMARRYGMLPVVELEGSTNGSF